MAQNSPKISVIIPVYNDVKYLRTCLNSVFNQTKKPNQVIVVDNNCTDDTVKIAREFHRVKVIKEPRQGLCWARNAGFDAAFGDYLVRIDADTVLPNDHIEQLLNLIDENPSMAGFTGYGVSRYEFIPKISIPWSIVYFLFTKAYLGYPVLWGANMVITKKYWNRLKNHLINDDLLVHEDQDLSLALASVGGKILITKELTVSAQMEGMLHYDQYRRYGRMLNYLKRKDKIMKRYRLKRRLPTINIFLRAFYYLITVWAVYGFYLVTIIYTAWWNVKRFMLAH